MKKRIKPLLITLLVLFAVFISGKYLLDLVFAGACGNQIQKSVPSPGGDKVAYVFLRDCGATTNYSPQLSILKKDEDLENESGNTFKSDKSFSIEWLNESTLQVTYSKSSETFEKDTSVNGVKIKYIEE
ncbi:hypothetical protein PH210_22165 [Paenibacillus sp. BSR1-1]|uniref:hypothetical protein n=1 Tax=Paenibacillus sp. BSR1-1 TaxID=3020845 RepID=UPI0025B228B8|nr:hypothetical protein [Paenibacillus sp. BSR1-1]MDN3018881.1 hypothetical protein [Paenibacillus sp. BSR1-1]